MIKDFGAARRQYVEKRNWVKDRESYTWKKTALLRYLS